MTPIRSQPLASAPQAATPKPPREAGRLAAQKAFFALAAGAAPAAGPASARPAAQPAPATPAEPPGRPLRPGSLLDIRV